jgi:hypothetical protein
MMTCDGCGKDMAKASSSDDESGLAFCLRCTTLDWPDERDHAVPCRRCRRKTWNRSGFCSDECERKDRWLDEMSQ